MTGLVAGLVRPVPLVVDGRRPAVERVAALRRVVTARERVVLLVLALASSDGLEAVVDVHELAAWAGLHRAETHSILRRLAAPSECRPALLERVAVDRAQLVTYRLLPDFAGGA